MAETEQPTGGGPALSVGLVEQAERSAVQNDVGNFSGRPVETVQQREDRTVPNYLVRNVASSVGVQALPDK